RFCQERWTQARFTGKNGGAMNSPSRRTFLKTTGAVGAVIAASRSLPPAPLPLPLGLPLFLVPTLLPPDFDGTLKQLYAAGYREVEAAGYFDKSAADFRHAMDQTGLRCISTHLNLTVLRTKLDESIAYAHALGLEYIICSSSGGVHRDPATKG